MSYKKNTITRNPFVPKFPPSPEQGAIFDAIKYGIGNLHVEAGAGSGKTTTAVWAMTLDRNKQSTAVLAFNKDIAADIASKAPEHVVVKTAHAMGYGCLSQHFGQVELKKGYESKTRMIIKDYSFLNEKKMKGVTKGEARSLLKNTERLVSLLKLTLTDERNPDDIYAVADRYSLDFKIGTNREDMLPQIISILPDVMDTIRGMTNLIDFDDMVWLPIQYQLNVRQFDMLYVDECQDLSNMLLKFAAMLRGDRIITIGDRFQSIYGFAGASTESIPNIINQFESDTLPLMTCYRCGHNIIKEVNKIMPDLKAYEGNCEGEVNRIFDSKEFKWTDLEEGSMVLSRRNASLIKPCFEILKSGRKAIIKGKDIGAALSDIVDSVQGSSPCSMIQFIDRLDVWRDEKIKAIEERENPQPNMIEKITDEYGAVLALSEGAENVFEVKNRIANIFSDETSSGVICSSIHKSKGLEADRVVIANAGAIRMNNDRMKPDDHIQERNLEYVGKTRAKRQLDLLYV